ncbi:AI-2E transporter [Gracilaria domingensis]|nr:AI-2E transporter [Gracilaria domingensis]
MHHGPLAMAFLAPQPIRPLLRDCSTQFLHARSLRYNARPRSRRKRRAASIQCLSGRELAGVAVRTSEKALESLDAKRVASWAGLALVLYALRSFFPVILGTFILGYVTNSVVRWMSNLTAGRAPRRFVVGVFYAFIITAISGFSLMTIPTVVREGQYFISTIQSENPYVYVANTMRKALGDDLTTKLEAYVMTSVEMPEAAAKGTLPGKPTPLAILDAKIDNSDVWTEARSRRLGILLQKSIRSYIAATITLITRLLGASTKVIFKAVLSLIFSFMIMWDLPVISRGVKRLKTSRLSFAYEELSPVVAKFGSVVGKSFEAQGLIAIVNTALTTAGLLVLSIPGVGFLSVVTLVCSFIPVAGVFVSTLPMCIIALSEYGVAKAVAVIVMVILVHLIEAYVLNPQIYSAHLHLHPFMVLVVLYIAEHSYGIPGLLMAVPVAVYILRTIMTDDAERTQRTLPTTVLGEQGQPVAE